MYEATKYQHFAGAGPSTMVNNGNQVLMNNDYLGEINNAQQMMYNNHTQYRAHNQSTVEPSPFNMPEVTMDLQCLMNDFASSNNTVLNMVKKEAPEYVENVNGVESCTWSNNPNLSSNSMISANMLQLQQNVHNNKHFLTKMQFSTQSEGKGSPSPSTSNQPMAVDAKHAKSVSATGSNEEDKNNEDYRRRRELNNIAVRKSRAKAKKKGLELEEQMRNLLKSNDLMRQHVNQLTEDIRTSSIHLNKIASTLPPEDYHKIITHLEDFHRARGTLQPINSQGPAQNNQQ